MFCDHGCDMNEEYEGCQSPLIFSAESGYDDICMYLSLRTKNINQEDCSSGMTIFVIYILKEKLECASQLLMRGADINYKSQKLDGLTPLHIALEGQMPQKVIKFLIKNGADTLIEDMEGKNCLKKIEESELYPQLKEFIKKKAKEVEELKENEPSPPPLQRTNIAGQF